MNRTVPVNEREAMTEARELAEMLAVIVGVQTPTQARAWLLDQVTSINGLANVALSAATMVDQSEDNADAYAAAIRERFDPPKVKPK